MSEKTEKSIIFLGNGYILTDEEEELIEKCSKNEIIVLTYSRIEDKKVDIERVRRKCGKKTEYEEVRETSSIMELINGWNREYELHIDVTFAAPYHAMELTPFGYLEGNRVTVMVNGELRSTEQRYIDFGRLNDTELEVIEELISHGSRTVKEIKEEWNKQKRKAKKVMKRDGYEGKPNFTNTLYRTVNKLTANGYISKEDGRPAKFFLDNNQLFMYRLTRDRTRSEPSETE